MMEIQGLVVDDNVAKQWSMSLYKNTSTKAVAEFKEMERVKTRMSAVVIMSESGKKKVYLLSHR